MENQQAEKPRTVTLAVNLMWGSLALGLVKVPLDLPSLAATPNPAVVWSVLVMVLALFCLLIYQISAGRNWARITFLVLFLVGLVFALPTLGAEFTRSPALGVLSVVQAVIQAYALFLVFSAPGKAWFQKKAAAPAP